MNRLKSRIVSLYTGQAQRSVRFRYALIVFDLATVAYFIAVTPFPMTPLIKAINVLLAIVILADFLCRLWIAPNRWAHLGRVYVIADVIVLGSLLFDPFIAINLTFLRILRGLRLGHSNYLLQDLRSGSQFFREHEDALVAALNLVVFVFVTTSGVFELFADANRGMAGYIDSLYYTVTTLTTTGYGDLTPQTPPAKLFAILIMVVGVSLFLRLAGAIFTPNKVHAPCPTCGLTRHDIDAVHCKHCGGMVKIETKGAG
ncbi:ion channel [Tropicimonas sp. TH_r6]|uniref:ion channel n=1 Tax=Tropicimonas sp. TH_r6 TaxID=3082085 RepID=UPI00295526D7|nr:ion channel [Tropicimonas sp. TH_r6]MDV7143790.1 ion channel [Tropicimonas sp. TH_r6]